MGSDPEPEARVLEHAGRLVCSVRKICVQSDP